MAEFEKVFIIKYIVEPDSSTSFDGYVKNDFKTHDDAEKYILEEGANLITNLEKEDKVYYRIEEFYKLKK